LEFDVQVRKAAIEHGEGEGAVPGAALPEPFRELAVFVAWGCLAAGALAIGCGARVFAVALPFESATGGVVADGGFEL
jgi:hypothetical protein